MPNYNTNLQSNNIDLQAILNTINELPSAGDSEPTLQDKTVTPTTNKQTITADSGYDGLDTVTVNAMPTVAQATPSITINSSGLITAKATQMAGYVTAGTKSATKQLAFQAAKTITPGTMDQTAIDAGMYAAGAVTVKGDSNLVASNIVSGKSIFGVVGTATAGSGGSGGNTDAADGLITKTITTYSNDRVTSIGSFAFGYCYSLATASFPACTNIGSSAFYSCRSLTTASFPVCTSIGNYAFCYCYSLPTVNFPACTDIGNYAFSGCRSLTTANFPTCTNIGSSAFFDCNALQTVSFPACTNIGKSAFYNCRSLTTANFPACTNIDSTAFGYCSALPTVNFPACTNIGNYAFYNCRSLATASFPACTNIGINAFWYCTLLSTLYLMASTLCTLSNSNTFSKAGITSTTGLIYVPASLLTSYQTATNWAYFSTRFVGLEGDGEIISFTFNGTSYQAPGGITWEQWEATEYNTNNDFVVYSDVVTYQDSTGNRTAVIDDTGTKVKPNDLIKSNGVYTT